MPKLISKPSPFIPNVEDNIFRSYIDKDQFIKKYSDYLQINMELKYTPDHTGKLQQEIYIYEEGEEYPYESHKEDLHRQAEIKYLLAKNNNDRSFLVREILEEYYKDKSKGYIKISAYEAAIIEIARHILCEIIAEKLNKKEKPSIYCYDEYYEDFKKLEEDLNLILGQQIKWRFAQYDKDNDKEFCTSQILSTISDLISKNRGEKNEQ